MKIPEVPVVFMYVGYKAHIISFKLSNTRF